LTGSGAGQGLGVALSDLEVAGGTLFEDGGDDWQSFDIELFNHVLLGRLDPAEDQKALKSLYVGHHAVYDCRLVRLGVTEQHNNGFVLAEGLLDLEGEVLSGQLCEVGVADELV
jgi:hypothetical protein